jgi:hypothetical protein
VHYSASGQCISDIVMAALEVHYLLHYLALYPE